MRLVTWVWSACFILCMTGSFGLIWLFRQRSTLGGVAPMFSFQGQTAKSTSQKYHGHSSPGVGPSWLSMPGTWERPGRKCSGDNRPFHQVHSGICNKNPNGTNDGKDPMGQIYCPLWSPWKDFNWIKDEVLRVSWWLTSVSWWEYERYKPVCIICRPMVNVKGSTPLWSICLGLYPRKRSQSGRTTLEHRSMHIIALKIQPQGSAPTISCLADNLTFQLMWHLVWLHCTIMEPNTTKFIQKLREHTKMGSHEKAEAFQAKEALRDKCNYDRRTRAAALKVGDTVLVHVTTFKGCIIKSRIDGKIGNM